MKFLFNIKKTAIALLFLLHAGLLQAQVIEEIVAVVADKIILRSELEIEYEQISRELGIKGDSLKCAILRNKLEERLFVVKAQVDSIEISEERVDAEIEERIRYFARQFGGEKALEEFYGKPISEIKAGNREKIKNQQLMDEMKRKIIKDIKITPSDVKQFYNSLDKDSLPLFSAEVEVAQIIIEPKVSKVAKQIAYEKIADLRRRIVENGEKFSTLALMYSDDKASASQGGDLGFFSRGQMVPEFEAAAFKTKPDSVSKIIETKYGYHILQVISRKGDEVHARHILITPKTYSSDIELSRRLADSIYNLIKMDSISFTDAAKKFSDDEATKASGGFLGSSNMGSTSIPVDVLEREMYLRIQDLKPGEITEPELIIMPGIEPKRVWRMLYLKSETPPHRANLKDDYQKLQQMATAKKQMDAIKKWIDKNRKDFYVEVHGWYANCDDIKPWISKSKLK